ncbi:MAG TPA: HAD-IB family phosphatase [Candidatus Saccharimonadia bacterium]
MPTPTSPKAVVFDIDGTLTPILSWLDFTAALGASVEEHRAIFRDYLDERITYEESRIQLLALWQGTGKANRRTIEAIFNSWPLDPAAVPLIHDLHDRGLHVCLITGSFDVYAANVSGRLGVTHWYANTEFIFDEHDELISYNYMRDQANEKLAQFQKFLAATKLKPTDCLAVGDGPNDLELFKATGRGIFIEPKFNRDDLADIRASAWRTVHNLAEAKAVIKQIL